MLKVVKLHFFVKNSNKNNFDWEIMRIFALDLWVLITEENVGKFFIWKL